MSRKCYTIALLRKPVTPSSKWELVAHGARYDPADAFATRDTYTAKGHTVYLLPLLLPEDAA